MRGSQNSKVGHVDGTGGFSGLGVPFVESGCCGGPRRGRKEEK